MYLFVLWSKYLLAYPNGLFIPDGGDHADIRNPSDIVPYCLNTSEYNLPDTDPEGMSLYGMYSEGTYVNMSPLYCSVG